MFLLFYICKSHYFFFGILILIEIARINLRLSNQSNSKIIVVQKTITTPINDTKLFYSKNTKILNKHIKFINIQSPTKNYLLLKYYKIFIYKHTTIKLPTQCPTVNWQMMLNNIIDMYSKITKTTV